MTSEFCDTLTLDSGWNNLAVKMRDAGYQGIMGFTFLSISPDDDAPGDVWLFHHDSALIEPVGNPEGNVIDQSITFPAGTSGALKWLYVDAETDVRVIARS